MIKKLFFAAMMAVSYGVSAQDIKLPSPDMKAKSSTVIDALAKRHSSREFASTLVEHSR